MKSTVVRRTSGASLNASMSVLAQFARSIHRLMVHGPLVNLPSAPDYNRRVVLVQEHRCDKSKPPSVRHSC
eukprot:1862049-Pyramimonas_sp.AAC.1